MSATLIRDRLEKVLKDYGYVLLSLEETESNKLIESDGLITKVEGLETRMLVVKAVHVYSNRKQYRE